MKQYPLRISPFQSAIFVLCISSQEHHVNLQMTGSASGKSLPRFH